MDWSALSDVGSSVLSLDNKTPRGHECDKSIENQKTLNIWTLLTFLHNVEISINDGKLMYNYQFLIQYLEVEICIVGYITSWTKKLTRIKILLLLIECTANCNTEIFFQYARPFLIKNISRNAFIQLNILN